VAGDAPTVGPHHVSNDDGRPDAIRNHVPGLWEESGEVVSEYEVADLLRETLIADGLLAKANAVFLEAVEQVTSATVMANTAGEDRRKAEVRKRFLAARLAELEQRQRAAQPEVEGLGHVEH